MKFSPQSVSALVDIAIGRPTKGAHIGRRKAHADALVARLGREGAGGIWSGEELLERTVRDISDSQGAAGMEAVVQVFFDPRDYVDHPGIREEYADYVNRVMEFDGYRVDVSTAGASLAVLGAASDRPTMRKGRVLTGGLGGRYEIGGQLGQGGAGTVYCCTRLGGSSEIFAAKVFLPQFRSEDKMKRFQNEVRFCFEATHPRIVNVVDFNLAQSPNTPFYVMPKYSSTLRGVIDAGIDSSMVLEIFKQILDGVGAAHACNVWHRDLKPENILLRTESTDVVVADFGIAHICEELLHTKVETSTKDRLANFQYAAPEQRRRGEEVDHRADVYSLGLILHEMFTRRIPIGQAYRAIEVDHAGYGFVDDVVASMLRDNPSERPTSIKEIARELRLLPFPRNTSELRSSDVRGGTWDEAWFEAHGTGARDGMAGAALEGFLEIRATMSISEQIATQKDLLNAAEVSKSTHSGWPLGTFNADRESRRPKVMADEIVAAFTSDTGSTMFDYWALRRNGDIYLAQSFSEDLGHEKILTLEPQLGRIVEAFSYCGRFYEALGVDPEELVHVSISHQGIEGRRLDALSDVWRRNLRYKVKSATEGCATTVTSFRLRDLPERLHALAKSVLDDLLVLFDFFELEQRYFDPIMADLRHTHSA